MKVVPVALNVLVFKVYAPDPDMLMVLDVAVNVPELLRYSPVLPKVSVQDDEMVNVPELVI